MELNKNSVIYGVIERTQTILEIGLLRKKVILNMKMTSCRLLMAKMRLRPYIKTHLIL